MVRGRYGRIRRRVASTLAAFLTLAAPWAFSDALAAQNAPETKAASAKVAEATTKPVARPAKSLRDGKVAKARPKKVAAKGTTAVKRAADKAGAKREEPHGHDHDEVILHAKHDASGAHVNVVLARHETKPAPAKSSKPVAAKAGKPVASAKNDKGAKPAKHDKSTTAAKNDAKSTITAKHEKPVGAAKTEKPTTVAKHEIGKEKPGATSGRRSKKASAALPGGKRKGSKKVAVEPPCFAPAVAIDRNGLEGESFSLTDCKGAVLADAREKFSVLARPWGTPRPELASRKKVKKPELRTESKDKKDKPTGKAKAEAETAEANPQEIAPNVRLLDPGLISRVETIAKHYPGKGISLVSGYRPKSRGSLHQTARALDLRVTGVSNEELVAFCKTITDTGCGYYPNSSFVHVDVRAPGTGSVTWIDASGPGEAPRYVAQWPLPLETTAADASVAAPAGAGEAAKDQGEGKTNGATAAKEADSKAPVASKEADSKTPVASKEAEPKAPVVQKEADPKTPDKNDAACETPSATSKPTTPPKAD
jgi:uncharacterized protein YcbK (DUF882 family)